MIQSIFKFYLPVLGVGEGHKQEQPGLFCGQISTGESQITGRAKNRRLRVCSLARGSLSIPTPPHPEPMRCFGPPGSLAGSQGDSCACLRLSHVPITHPGLPLRSPSPAKLSASSPLVLRYLPGAYLSHQVTSLSSRPRTLRGTVRLPPRGR